MQVDKAKKSIHQDVLDDQGNLPGGISGHGPAHTKLVGNIAETGRDD